MCAFRTWKRLPAILERSGVVIEAEKQGLDTLCSTVFDSGSKSTTTLVMGDLWPGNILVRLAHGEAGLELEEIMIGDWELVHPGRPACDLGQPISEIWLAGKFATQNQEAAETMVRSFLKQYVGAGCSKRRIRVGLQRNLQRREQT